MKTAAAMVVLAAVQACSGGYPRPEPIPANAPGFEAILAEAGQSVRGSYLPECRSQLPEQLWLISPARPPSGKLRVRRSVVDWPRARDTLQVTVIEARCLSGNLEYVEFGHDSLRIGLDTDPVATGHKIHGVYERKGEGLVELVWSGDRPPTAQERREARQRRIQVFLDQGWSRTQAIAVINNDVLVGMSEEMVRAAWGSPRDVNRTTTRHGTREQWVYGGVGDRRYVYLEDGVVTAIQDSR